MSKFYRIFYDVDRWITDELLQKLLMAKQPYLAWRAKELSGAVVNELLDAKIISKEKFVTHWVSTDDKRQAPVHWCLPFL